MKLSILLLTSVILINSNTWAQAPFNTPDNIGAGNCLEFDGVSNRFDIPHQAPLQFGTGSCTLEAWIRPNHIGTTYGFIFSKGVAGSGSYHAPMYSLALYNNTIHANFEGGSVATFASILSPPIVTAPDVWYHVATVKNSSANQLSVFINGEFQASTSVGVSNQNTNTTTPLRIGVMDHFSGLQNYFPGQIDEVRVWNVARTQTQIRDNMCRQLTGTETGLVGYWNMNEGADNTCTGAEDVCDQSGNGNHGTKF